MGKLIGMLSFPGTCHSCDVMNRFHQEVPLLSYVKRLSLLPVIVGSYPHNDAITVERGSTGCVARTNLRRYLEHLQAIALYLSLLARY